MNRLIEISRKSYTSNCLTIPQTSRVIVKSMVRDTGSSQHAQKHKKTISTKDVMKVLLRSRR